MSTNPLALRGMRSLVAVLLPLVVVQVARSGPSVAELDRSTSEVKSAIERYLADRGSLLRYYPVELAPARTARLKDFHSEWLAGLRVLNFEALSHEGKIDYLLFKNHLDHEVRQFELRARGQAEIASFIPFAATIVGLEEGRKRLDPIDSARLAATLTTLAREVETASRIADPALARTKRHLLLRAAGTVTSLRNTLRNWFEFYNGYDPVFTWWNGEPYKVVDAALQNYANALGAPAGAAAPPVATTPAGAPRSSRSGDIIGNPLGREALLSELAYEMIPYTPDELIAIANKEYEWCESEMKKAARDLGFGDDWHAALEHVKTLHVEPGKQPEMIRGLALEAIKFVEERDLVTVPPLAKETWRMEMMSPQQQLVSPFFLGGETIMVSFPTNTMSHEAKRMSMRGNNLHFSRATVHHELIPGHHLQGFMTARYKAYRSLFSTPFWTEGNALYWEFLLWDLGFPSLTDPDKFAENRIGMLFWRMHRCARIIFSLSFHLDKMTPQECIELLVTKVGHERDNATAEVRRSFGGAYGPLYQCAYMLGGLQTYALHRELVNSGKLTNRQFHDAILREGRIPIELLRASLTKQPLTRDFKSAWKFYGTSSGRK